MSQDTPVTQSEARDAAYSILEGMWYVLSASVIVSAMMPMYLVFSKQWNYLPILAVHIVIVIYARVQIRKLKKKHEGTIILIDPNAKDPQKK